MHHPIGSHPDMWFSISMDARQQLLSQAASSSTPAQQLSLDVALAGP